MARIARIVGGVALIVAGIFMLVLPGPGIITIIGGLALLAQDVAWASLSSATSHPRRADRRASYSGPARGGGRTSRVRPVVGWVVTVNPRWWTTM